VDDGVVDRGHRTNTFNPTVKVFACYTGPHSIYGIMTTLDFAGGFTKPGGGDWIIQGGADSIKLGEADCSKLLGEADQYIK